MIVICTYFLLCGMGSGFLIRYLFFENKFNKKEIIQEVSELNFNNREVWRLIKKSKTNKMDDKTHNIFEIIQKILSENDSKGIKLINKIKDLKWNKKRRAQK